MVVFPVEICLRRFASDNVGLAGVKNYGRKLKFIKKRATATGAAQVSMVAKWLWSEKPAAQWALDVKALEDQEVVAKTSETKMNGSRIALNAKIDLLHMLTVQGLGISKSRNRNNPANLAQLKNLNAGCLGKN